MNSVEVAVWSGYALVSVGLIILVWKAIQKMSASPSKKSAPAEPAKPVRTEKAKSGLQSDILKEGSGAKAKKGDMLTVHYTAFLPTGEEVDSSHDPGRKALTFKLGAGKMIDGWEKALVGAQAGEIRKVTVPSSLAYGRNGSPSGKVPPNTNVVFDIEVLKIE